MSYIPTRYEAALGDTVIFDNNAEQVEESSGNWQLEENAERTLPGVEITATATNERALQTLFLFSFYLATAEYQRYSHTWFWRALAASSSSSSSQNPPMMIPPIRWLEEKQLLLSFFSFSFSLQSSVLYRCSVSEVIPLVV